MGCAPRASDYDRRSLLCGISSSDECHRRRSDILPFILALLQFGLGIAGTALVIFPDLVPFRLTLWDASSSTLSQIFLLTGATIVTPVILAYSAFAYSVFRGKTPEKGWE